MFPTVDLHAAESKWYEETTPTDEDCLILEDDGSTLVEITEDAPQTVILPEGIEVIERMALGEGVENIKFPSTLKKIEEGAFINAWSLSEIYINSNVFISNDVFPDNGLEDVIIGPKAERYYEIDEDCLYQKDCNVYRVSEEDYESTDVFLAGGRRLVAVFGSSKVADNFSIPDNVVSVADGAFPSYAGITSLSIGAYCYDIGCQQLPHLTEVVLSPDNPVYEMQDNVLLRRGEVQVDDNKVFYEPMVRNAEEYGHTQWGDHYPGATLERFIMGKGVSEYVVPRYVTHLRGYAFYTPNGVTRDLKKVWIPDWASVYYLNGMFGGLTDVDWEEESSLPALTVCCSENAE